MDSSESVSKVLQDILSSLENLQKEQTQLAAAVDSITAKVNVLADVRQLDDTTSANTPKNTEVPNSNDGHNAPFSDLFRGASISPQPIEINTPSLLENTPRRTSTTSKIILTSYPGQSGVDPIPMQWGHRDPAQRGPVVVVRNRSTIRRRNGG